ncbi:Pickpocket protein 11 [Eumeta japonica]|uniref:Pickpocket protein 11 n=1 Tax=Eumeta variegata TaxID=151549 RepID=A0A4C1ZBP0_EUMVA|nr:Pickpocket protein 11 [Eumeta japonica]
MGAIDYVEQPLQSQLVTEELLCKSSRRPAPNAKQTWPVHIYRSVKSYLVLFFNTSSIHGLNHLVAFGRHPFEILLWLTTVAASVFGATSLSRATWLRYQSSPTVVSMDRDMFAWNTTFPAVTICPETKLDEHKLAVYVKRSNATDKEKLLSFIRALSNATYESFGEVPDYPDLRADNYMELLLNLSAAFGPTLTIGATGIALNIQPTITEMGLCYAINSKTAIYNSPEYRAANRWDLVTNHNETFFVHPLDGEVFTQVINLSTAYDVYIHGPLEVPEQSSKSQHSDNGFYMKVYVTALSVYIAPEAANLCDVRLRSDPHTFFGRLSVAQRKCRFPHENVLRHNAVYAYNLCRVECRVRMCLQHCRCLPHFYRKIGNERICDAAGLRCLARHKDELTTLKSKEGRNRCECLPLCDDVNYVIQSSVSSANQFCKYKTFSSNPP